MYWIDSVDTDTEDDSSKTDMSDIITEKLETYGYCHLGPGIFYVRGNIDMPYGSTIEGCGKNTIIRMLSDSPCDYIIRPLGKSSISKLTLSGGYNEPDLSSGDAGNKHGIQFSANADGKEEPQPNALACTINQVWIENIDGSGIYCHNTGGSIRESLTVSNCNIENCRIGINIDYYSEYHKFSETKVYKCYCACINNGGNNVFSSCTFHGTIGFLIDNSDGTRRNIAHGTAVGCTFNHTDNWNQPSTLGGGDAIVVKDAKSGFVFTGCQIWYGQIKIYNSEGIAFSDCLLGGNNPPITVTGEKAACFNDCTFYQYPVLNINCSTRIKNCYCVLTNEEIINNTEHDFDNGTTIKAATTSQEGIIQYTCKACGITKKKTIAIIKPEPKKQIQPVLIKDLPAIKIVKPKVTKKAVLVKWKKLSKKTRKKVQGIEVQYSKDNFKTIERTRLVKKTKTSIKIKGLKSNKYCWIRIRTYKNAADGKHVSPWKIRRVKL